MSGTVAIARSLAAAHPNATLPCPLCSASVNAVNLEQHLGKVHATALQDASSGAIVRLTGVDRRIRRPLFALPVVWLLAALSSVIAGVPLTDASVAIMGAGLLVFGFVPVFVALRGLVQARIELEGEVVRLIWAFGRTTVALPAKLESGRLLERAANVLDHQHETGPGTDKHAGVYLCLRQDGTSITVGAPKAAGLGKDWAANGWSKGPARRSWDITVDRNALVAIEYHLAARGLLSPRVNST
jgi:hypothetical protein